MESSLKVQHSRYPAPEEVLPYAAPAKRVRENNRTEPHETAEQRAAWVSAGVAAREATKKIHREYVVKGHRNMHNDQ